ncbi:alginate lyase family protein [Aureimonas flava]|nr:alginate lyase family protein [Aureimonas flava]
MKPIREARSRPAGAIPVLAALAAVLGVAPALSAPCYPFDLPQAVGSPSEPQEAVRCGHVVKPTVDMSGLFSFYGPGASQSVVDREKMGAYVRRINGMERFKGAIFLWLTRYEREPARRAGAARCLQEMLVAWARAGAMLEGHDRNDANGRRQAALLASWTAIGAVNGFQAADRGEWPAGERAQVLAWFGRLSEAIGGGFPELPPSPRASGWSKPTTNHAHWGATALAMLAIARGDEGGVDLAAFQLGRALGTATAEGAMPQELRRGGKALHYQIFALDAIALLVRVVEANGRELTGAQASQLAAVTRFTLDAWDDPSLLRAYSPKPQEMPKALPSFVELLRDHFRHADPAISHRLECAAAKLGPLSSPFIAMNISDRVSPPQPGACAH